VLVPGKLFQLGAMLVAKARGPTLVEHLKGASLR